MKHHVNKAPHIGTSGWTLTDWYPETIPSAKRLEYYSQVFNTVEINTTFYHIPRISTVEKWYDETPDNFTFAIKASRYITHMKRLHDTEESIERFFKAIARLNEKTGPILFQLPPSLKKDLELLETFIKTLPSDYKHTIEFRHPSWHEDDVYELLKENNVAFCIFDISGKTSPELVTADFSYIRLHGPEKKYIGSYSKKVLKHWAEHAEQCLKKHKDIYVYFDNTIKRDAPDNAETLQRILNQATLLAS